MELTSALDKIHDSEYWRVLLSSMNIWWRLLVELIDDSWDPEEEDDSDGEIGPFEPKLVAILCWSLFAADMWI